MSSILEICQRTARELEIPGSGPNSVVSQVGQEAQVVRWVFAANREIQRMHLNWKFMKVLDASFNTVAGTQDYILTTGIGLTEYSRVDPNTIRFYKLSDGVAFEQPLAMITWEEWEEKYQTAYLAQPSNAPSFLVELPDGITWRLSTAPDDIYVITFNYFRLPQNFLDTSLYADPDLPTVSSHIPVRFEDAIVGKAMMKYGRQYEAQDKLADGKELYDEAISDMVITQLPFLEHPDAMGNE